MVYFSLEEKQYKFFQSLDVKPQLEMTQWDVTWVGGVEVKCTATANFVEKKRQYHISIPVEGIFAVMSILER